MTQSNDAPTVAPSGNGAPAAKPKRGGGMWLNVVLAIAVFAAVGGVAFAAGRLTAPASAVLPGGGNFPGGNFPRGSFQPNASFGTGGNFPGGPGGGGVTLEGTVVSKTDTTMTITTSTGQTIEVSLPSTTTYHTQSAASSNDVQSGSTVQVEVDLAGGQGQGAGQGQFTASDVTIVP